MKEIFVCWSNITLYKADCLMRLKRCLISIMVNRHFRLEQFISGFNEPKKTKTETLADKVMATVFWDSDGIISINYFENVETITCAHYASLLDCLKIELQDKRPRLPQKKVLYHRDNAPDQPLSRWLNFHIGKKVVVQGSQMWRIREMRNVLES